MAAGDRERSIRLAERERDRLWRLAIGERDRESRLAAAADDETERERECDRFLVALVRRLWSSAIERSVYDVWFVFDD